MAEQPVSEPTREERIAALPPLQEGYRYLYNRSSEPWEHQFDGRVYKFEPHEVRSIPSNAAELFRADSIIPGTLRRVRGGGGTLVAERYVAFGPGWAIHGSVKIQEDYVIQYAPAEAEADFLVPTTTEPTMELFDRTSIPSYVDRPNVRDPGKPLHAAIVRV